MTRRTLFCMEMRWKNTLVVDRKYLDLKYVITRGHLKPDCSSHILLSIDIRNIYYKKYYSPNIIIVIIINVVVCKSQT